MLVVYGAAAVCYIIFFVKDTAQTRKLTIVAQLISMLASVCGIILMIKIGGYAQTLFDALRKWINDDVNNGSYMAAVNIKSIVVGVSAPIFVITMALNLYWASAAYRFSKQEAPN